MNLNIRNLVNQRKTKNINMHLAFLATCAGIAASENSDTAAVGVDFVYCVLTIKRRLDL